MPYCQYCGNEVGTDHRFCSRCGKELALKNSEATTENNKMSEAYVLGVVGIALIFFFFPAAPLVSSIGLYKADKTNDEKAFKLCLVGTIVSILMIVVPLSLYILYILSLML
ncbi:MAG: zinc-ribbon domain-containing protein [Bacilli bacterium]|nr:zinc-ribbon domain-containing protein [Bacilli bacterium]